MQNQETLRKALNFVKTGRGNREVLAASFLLIRNKVIHLFPDFIDNPILKEILRELDVFTYREIDVIMETGTPANIVSLTSITAGKMAGLAMSLPREKIHQIAWRENTNKVIAEVKEEFPEWFAVIEEKVRLQDQANQFERDVSFSLARVLKIGATSVMDEKQVTTLKDQFTKLFEEIKVRIESSDCPAEVKEKLICTDWAKAYEKALAHIDQKYAQQPVRILYYRTGNRVTVKLGWGKDTCKYHTGRGKEIRLNRGNDYKEYKLIVSLAYIEDFLYLNDVLCDDVWVEEGSIKSCYRFNDKISVNLTPAFVREWYNYDAPTLERIQPNIGKCGVNMLGMGLLHFTTNLVESWKYIAEDITLEEAEALMRGYEHTGISREICNALKARELKDQIDDIKSWVEAYDARIQNVIDKNAEVITNSLVIAFYDRATLTTGTDETPSSFHFNDDFGFDCGFLNIRVNDSEYMEKRSILRNALNSVSSYMNLKLPIFSQSTTFMRKQFEIVREIVKEKTGIELVGHTVLD